MQTKILIVVPNYWGKGETINEAWDSVKRFSCDTLRTLKKTYKMYVVTDTDDVKSCVNGMGGLVYPEGYEPKLIDEK